MPNAFLILIAGSVVLASAFAAWLWHLRLKNAGVIDVVWGLNQALAAAVFAILGRGWPPRRALIAALVSLTGLRLTYYLSRRVLGHPEEGRYVALREEWGAKGNIKLIFLAFFLFQAVLGVLLSLPFLLVAQNEAVGFSYLELAAVGLFINGFLGETVADLELKRFKADPANKGKTCRDGLWRYSRHPNYFFEWLMWLSYFVLSCAVPYGWLTVYAPALMLHFLLNVTGVKITEEQCLRTRGEDYARYQRETSAFVPWFVKTDSPTRSSPHPPRAR
jgi:steroid 5-alpha reductase family enzyme